MIINILRNNSCHCQANILNLWKKIETNNDFFEINYLIFFHVDNDIKLDLGAFTSQFFYIQMFHTIINNF